MNNHPAEIERPSPSLPKLVRVVRPFIVGAPYATPARSAEVGEVVALEHWLAVDLIATGAAEPA